MRVTFAIASSLALVLALSACGAPAERADAVASDGAAAPAQMKAEAPAAEADARPERPAISIPQLAYSYAYELSAPAKAIRAMVARHEAACAQAGPTVCQLTGSSVREMGDDRIEGTVKLRATPAWLGRFRAGLGSDVQAAGGRVTHASVVSEDLSRQIVDTEAAIRAKATLRDRLQALLASRPGKLSELLELERELAQVQGELDATQSELAVMRSRVATSELTLSYASAGVIAPEGVLAPLAEAVTGMVGILVLTLAGMVTVLAWTAPWALLAGGLYWVHRRRLAARAKKPAEQPAS